MPSFSGKLSDAEIAAVASYVSTVAGHRLLDAAVQNWISMTFLSWVATHTELAFTASASGEAVNLIAPVTAGVPVFVIR